MGKGERLHYFFALVFFLIILMVVRLFDIQVLSHPYFYKRALSQWQGLSQEEIRGGIFDRNGRSLLDSHQVNYALISPRWLKDSEIEYLKKNNILSLENPDKPQSVRLSSYNMAVIKNLVGRTPGVFVYQKEMRYGQNALATHVVGYRGQTGIEKTFDKFLNGGRTRTGIIYDGLGQPIPGASKENSLTVNWGVWLTIDREIQSAVEKVMDAEIQRGAVVVMDADTGEILAMASRPNYKQCNLDAYLNEKDAPLINRAVEAYIPGSIFKIIVLAAALEEKVADLDEEFYCSGAIRVGGNTIKCSSYEKGGHGRITLKDALAHSCNSVFIELGMRLGKEKVLEYAGKFGLGERVLRDLSEEKAGFIPATRDVYREDLGNLSIGQGNLQVTPLQAAQMLLIIVNDGIKIKPLLVKNVVDSSGLTVSSDFSETRYAGRVISADTTKKLKEALKAVTSYGSGTLSVPSKAPVKVAGKTGTAELGDGSNHAWFVGYFPAEHPRYIVTVFVEKGQSGPLKAAPVFRKIVEEIYYLTGR
ncbi:peptidoglycan D,D-transpeptidase FtsI family protein [Thermosediminibacter litoriperuensis]|uniref:Penicillin-binding protein 2 n=1 Tax=Thermosediminibacter litoriperuensis TaxID=291989 RepID=A0A5S5AMW2_9FIRM|nr:penicillin-binding transpeptidase domain-containing protein [Thermosediminibacter litoriperuensis]TYP51609.1 penicillin-binding protein 2 [Thermosediminibacter litoriperuensis]